MSAHHLDPATLDALGAWVVVLDLQGRFLHANRAMVEASGLAREEWLGKPVWEIFDLGEDDKAVQRIAADIESRQFPNSYQGAFRRADGTLLRSTWVNTALLDERGELVGIVGTALGLETEPEATAMLVESEERFQALARNARELISEFDEDGRLVFASPNHEAILGHPPERLLGHDALELVHPEDREDALAIGAELHDGGRAARTLRCRHADSSWRWLDASATTYRTSDDRVRTLVVSRDVTEQRLLEEARSSFGRILEESLNEIYVFDAETLRFLRVNRGARENLGYSMAELRNMTPLDLKPEFTAERLARLIKPLREGPLPRLDFEAVHRRKDGSEYPVEVHLQRVTLDDAPVFVAIILDLTERARAAEQLRKSERRAREAEGLASIGTLAAGLAHDIGTPMNVILGYAEMLRRSVPGDKDRERAHLISEQVRRISELIQTLLNLARPQAAERRPVDVARAIDEALAFYDEQLHKRGIRVKRHFEPVPAILGDAHRLQQVFLNLFVNAADAMPEGGTLSVHLACPDDRAVEVRVGDTGAGIEAEDLERIFEPFFTTKERGKGTGLGLLVSKGVVVDHGGALDATSRVGEGTEFRIALPVP